ncbi:YdeI/OmpD-associated family protein [Bradyrhizobium prioriisuperbiae]|uniref:YdeI/OmpD-associated family protein n=1 Tax=Bradyrhizobium prioriisuperbiae TaxID=2854389 RepID=UPI0028ED78C8|nr:YdeI/OmpD-associated family protein [Bradyrhizobium prioritasuperba]
MQKAPAQRASLKATARELPVRAFKSQLAWATWLAAQSAASPGVWLKLAKASAGTDSVSRQQAIDSALCHGWIDGQLSAFDADWWLIRFTPRKSNSRWSEKNRDRALELIAQREMRPAGQQQIDLAKADGRWEQAYAPASKAAVPDDLAAALAKNRKARAFFEGLDGTNRYAVLYRIHTARKPETRAQRIAVFVAMLARGETIHPRKAKT